MVIGTIERDTTANERLKRLNMSHRLNADVSWMVVAWLLLIASGASATGLLRAPIGTPGLGPAMLTSHVVFGAALGLIIVVHLLRGQGPRLRAVVAIGATVALGWLASRSFAPLTAAAHAAIAAYTIVALPTTFSAVAETQSRRPWKTSVARLGFALLLLQIALGALVRHQLMPVVWHMLVGGLAAVAILVPAVAITQDASSTPDEKRAARWAIASLLAQVSLGVGVLFMIMLGTPNPLLWVATTVSHVVVGSVTLLTSARLCCWSGDGRS
jgi:hypothetical protein